MAFSGNYMCTSFKTEIMAGVHNFTTASNVFKLALFTDSATLNATTVSYTASAAAGGEITAVGTNYTTTGEFMTSVTPAAIGTTALVDFSDVTFLNVTITGVRGALLYNNAPVSGGGTPAVCVLDFGVDKAANQGDFTVVMPTADASNALIRIA